MTCTPHKFLLFVNKFIIQLSVRNQIVIYIIFSITLSNYLQKEKSVDKRNFFIPHCKTFGAAINPLSAMNEY